MTLSDSPGGFFITRPEPLQVKRTTEVGITLMSDLHLGAAHVDYKRIERDLREAKAAGDRILINGDVFDFILPSDHKRFSPDALHSRLRGRRDILNACLEWGTEFLAPYADQIDMIGIGNHECFDAATEVLTDGGWVPFSELPPNAKVASYRHADGVVEFAEPLATQQYDFDGELVSINNTHLDLAVTPNHRILAKGRVESPSNGRRRPGEGQVTPTPTGWRACIKRAGKVSYGPVRKSREVANADRAAMVTDRSVQHLGDGWRMQAAGELPAIDLSIPCCGIAATPGVSIDDDMLRLIAWILTDGWISRNQVAVCQRESKAHSVEEILCRLGLDFNRASRKRDIKEVCGKKLKSAPEASVEFHLRGESRLKVLAWLPSKDRIPRWVADLTKGQFDVFLASVIDGDGSRHRRYPATSMMVYGKEPFLSALQAYCTVFGYRTSLSQYRPSAGSWRLNVNPRRFTTVRPSRVSRRPYVGKVYCVTTHNDTVIVRRNGKVAITGNSSVEKHHSADIVLLLCDQLSAIAGRTINYGGYTGYVDYRFRRGGPRSDTRRLVIYYHHGSGGQAPVTKGLINFHRAAPPGWTRMSSGTATATTGSRTLPAFGCAAPRRAIRRRPTSRSAS